MNRVSFDFDFSGFQNIDSLNQSVVIIDNESCSRGFSCLFTHDLISKTAHCSLSYDLDEEATSCSFGIVLDLLNVIYEKVHNSGLLSVINNINIS